MTSLTRLQSDEPGGATHVLVCDDDRAFVDGAEASLPRHSPELVVYTETDPESAVASLPPVDCVAVASDLPGTDWLDLLRTVRDRAPGVAFVLCLEADGDAEDQEVVGQALAAGVDDCLRKGGPAQYELLAARIGNAVARRRIETDRNRDDGGHGVGSGGENGNGVTGGDIDGASDDDEDGTDSTTPVPVSMDELKSRALDEVDAGVVIAEATEETPTVFANDGFGRITGYDPEELIGRNCRILQGEETDDRPVASMREAIAERRHVSVVLRNYRKDGTEFWNEVEITPVRDGEGTASHFIGVQRDVTERTRLRMELEAAQQSLRRLYTVTTDSSLSFEDRVERTLTIGRERLGVEIGFLTRIEDGTQTIAHAVGDDPQIQRGETCPLSESYCRRTLETDGLLSVVHAARDEGWTDDPGYERFGLECYLGGKVVVDGDLYGTLCFADTEPRAEPFSGSQAAFVELLTRWVGYELERRKGERELRIADRRFRSLFENPMTFVGVLDPDGTLREANDTALATLEETSDPVLGVPFWETPWWADSDEAAATVREAVETAADGEVARFECEYAHDDGDGTVSATLYPVYGDGSEEDHENGTVHGPGDDHGTDEVVSLMAVGGDTTTRTRQAAQLKRQRDRLEEFASVVSHDLRSPLEVARGRLELHDATGETAHLSAVDDALGRMSDLIDDLLTLARQGSAIDERDETRPAAVARQAWNTVDTSGTVLEVTVDAEATVDADAGRLQQLFENLFRNSVEHGSTGGRPGADETVEREPTDARAEGDGVTVRLTGLADGGGFAVEDDGPGIDPADREHVFDRGFTTDDDGTGFGLAIVKRVVDAHGWEIRVTEGTDGGARFEIRVDP